MPDVNPVEVPMQVEATAFADGSIKVATRSASMVMEPVLGREEAITLACTILRLAARTVTYDLSDPDVRGALTRALEDYRDRSRDRAVFLGADESLPGSFARHAEIAERMRAQAEAAGS